tara:strand:- start:342 stop:575 length:234 start_codon:yes stop_codon:yes gene_type:complete
MIILGYIAVGLLYVICGMFAFQLWRDRKELFNIPRWQDNVISRNESDQLELEREVELFNKSFWSKANSEYRKKNYSN